MEMIVSDVKVPLKKNSLANVLPSLAAIEQY